MKSKKEIVYQNHNFGLGHCRAFVNSLMWKVLRDKVNYLPKGSTPLLGANDANHLMKKVENDWPVTARTKNTLIQVINFVSVKNR